MRDMGSAKGISVAARTTIVRDAVAKRAPQLRQQPRGGILATVLVIWLLWTLAGWHGRSPALHMGDWSLGPPEIANATLGVGGSLVVRLGLMKMLTLHMQVPKDLRRQPAVTHGQA